MVKLEIGNAKIIGYNRFFKLAVPYNFPISHLLTVGYWVNTCLAKCLNRFLNGKAVVAPFNQEKALVGAFSVIVKTDCA